MELRLVRKFRVLVGKGKGIRPNGSQENTVVTAESFLSVEPVCMPDMLGKCKVRACVSTHRVTKTGWVCRVGLDGEAQGRNKLCQLSTKLVFPM